ncbi:hypothetical protein ACFQAT_28455 [Undibacterium arcticum]|uniref:DUF4034 domain-containing protein n=1 Tax=Undibacterium arcticum TaxID=1762892 RepID=A0ABV7F7E6_9BURK
MSGYVLFQMWEPFRQLLIEGHQFYVDQARRRLLSQFDDIESEADKAAADWLERNSHRFDPDRYDPGAFCEAAQEEGIAHYQLLNDMRDNTRLSVVAGMFHEWDKQLRDWMTREILHWHSGADVRAKIWSQNFGSLADLLACLGWDIRSRPYYRTLDACRLVVNVYKHGEGGSFQDLKRCYPEYIDNPLKGFDDPLDMDFRDHRDLKVTEEQIQGFSAAIVAFWNDVPPKIVDDPVGELPEWFEKAWLKDLKAAANRSR